MIDALFSQPDYVAAKKTLDVTVMRHEAIASNLANLETPGYKRIDVAASFEAELRQAVASQNPAQINSLQPRLALDTKAVTGRADGNTVQLETEMVKLNENTVEDAMETQLINTRLANMRLAITGR
jgi:flagellar basal-body rod protein FlgB